MAKRPIDTSVNQFYAFLAASTVGFWGLVALWVGLLGGRQAPYLNVAFCTTWVIMILLTVLVCEYTRRRPADAEATWGEAMLGATFAFALMFWIYGVVPHQWLTFAEAELNWRADRFVRGPSTFWDSNQGFVEWALPFDLTYRVIKDTLAVVIYGIALVGNVWLFMIWQNRGKVGEVAEVTSRYGRPLVKAKEGVNA